MRGVAGGSRRTHRVRNQRAAAGAGDAVAAGAGGTSPQDVLRALQQLLPAVMPLIPVLNQLVGQTPATAQRR
eukprot:14441155-Alexandrium_andersonii.AAC.1